MKILTPYMTTRNLNSDLWTEMDRFFDDWGSPVLARSYDERSFAPASEFIEADEHFILSLDVPGMKKDDIKIEMSENTLTVSGERKRETTDKNEKIQRYEKSYGFFKRSFALPSSIDADKVEAHYEDGVLELYLPKSVSAKPRSIQIQSGKTGVFERLLNTKKD